MIQERKKMLYLMHVSWYWIKQRPHFIAENLDNYYSLKVCYAKSFFPNKQLVKTDKPLFISHFYSLPLQRYLKFKFYRKISDYFNVLQLKRHIKNMDYVWFTSPNDYSMIKNRINDSQTIIYDCMDNFLEFELIKSSESLSLKMYLNEKDLLSRANYIFTSSEYLKKTLNNRHHFSQEIFVINNATSSSLFNKKNTPNRITYDKINGITDLLYVGTISHWFNFDLIIESLVKFENIRYILIGPTEIIIPNHDRIIHLGPKKHEELQSYMQKTDALIMPFIVNDLIKSVNPVKLYEYIFTGKPIITCQYDEINQFKEFVFSYNNSQAYFELISKLIKNELIQQTLEDCENFLHNNTWEKRVEKMVEVISLNSKPSKSLHNYI